MLILDKPYVSEFLQKTAAEMKTPVLKNQHIYEIIGNTGLNIVDETDFLSIAETKMPLRLYCNSENSINWITQNLSHTKIPRQIELCKDKVKFRQLLMKIYADFFFMEVDFEQLGKLDITKLKKPFIIKPSIGFFSIGVYKVESNEEWMATVECLQKDIKAAEGLYPDEVMNSAKFIIEECIEGEEYAIDAYYNSEGKPVILDILKHPFSSSTDVSDRLYFTSKEIILENLRPFENNLAEIGKLADFSDFPVHVEVRIDKNGRIIPIEFNPMRFAGWCVADIAYFAYGLNIYDYYLNNKEPDWSELLNNKHGKVFCLVLGDIPKNMEIEKIKEIDYDAFASKFNKVLELRKIDYRKYPVFAFTYIETASESGELEEVLKMDFGNFIKTV